MIGKITQIQLDDGGNLLNTNSHNIRLALFLMDEPKAEWVMGAVERTTGLRFYFATPYHSWEQAPTAAQVSCRRRPSSVRLSARWRRRSELSSGRVNARPRTRRRAPRRGVNRATD